MMKRTYVLAFAAVIILVLSAHAETRVAIRDPNLIGLGESSWAAANELGVKLLEVVVERNMSCPRLFVGKEKPYRIDTPENRQKLLADAKKNGCEIVAFCTVTGLPKDHTTNVAWIEKVAKAAAEMKVPIIMMALDKGRGLDQDEYIKRGIAFLKAVAPIARSTKVNITVENVGTFLNKQEVLKPLMEAVPDDQVGLALDITNMYWYGYPPAKIYELAKTFAPHVRYVHAKSIKYPPEQREKQRKPGWQYKKYAEPVCNGDLDFERILGYYFEAGFKGNITIEGEYLHKFDVAGKKKAIEDDAALLQKITAKISKSASGGK